MTLDPSHFRSAVPVIAAEDVLATVRYFDEMLGFQKHFVWGDPAVYAGVKLGAALIYITHDPDMARVIREHDLRPDVFIWVSEIDAVFAEHKARGAEIIEEISNRPWDARQYVVREPNGYYLKIAQPLD
jgi:uncharacterized glyoxalase superfamily protein PhnB